jgi:hypothetical protein
VAQATPAYTNLCHRKRAAHPRPIQPPWTRHRRAAPRSDCVGKHSFDLAMVAEWEPQALESIVPVLIDRSDVILKRIDEHDQSLRETFNELEVLDYQRTYDECIDIVRRTLA